MRKDRRKMKNAFVEYSDSTQIANFNMLQEKQIRDEKVTDASLDHLKMSLQVLVLKMEILRFLT